MAWRLISTGRLESPWRRHRLAIVAVAAAVAVVHGVVTCSAASNLSVPSHRELPRLKAAFVRELAPAEPPQPLAARPLLAPIAHARATPRSPKPPADAASKPAANEPADSEPAKTEPAKPEAASAVAAAEPPPIGAAITDLAGPADAAESAGSAGPPPFNEAASAAVAAPAELAFEWPPSTKLAYTLTGYFRGKFEGSAEVEWVRDGDRYQVHLDVIGGARIAPLFTRRMTSSGRLTADGLAPERYDETTSRLFGSTRQITIGFDDDWVRLANGQLREHLLGVQDAASQFVQLTWLFLTRRQTLAIGQRFDVPLALPRSLGIWTYEVAEAATLETPFGPLASFHVTPKRAAGANGELTAEIWFAPSLQYLPVRIRINQDAATYIDLMIERLPLQALPR